MYPWKNQQLAMFSAQTLRIIEKYESRMILHLSNKFLSNSKTTIPSMAAQILAVHNSFFIA